MGDDVEQHRTVRDAPSDADLQRAIASVPGVAQASVTRSPRTGRSHLRLRLSPGEDAEAVSWSVAATLRERFSIALDPDAIRPVASVDAGTDEAERDLEHELVDGVPDARDDADADPDGVADVTGHVAGDSTDAATQGDVTSVDPGAAGDPSTDPLRLVQVDPAAERADVPEVPEVEGRTARPAIRNLDTQLDESDVRVVATLEHLGRPAHGDAVAVATSQGVLRAVAEATIAALRQLASGPLLAGVDRITMQGAADPPIVTVVVTLLTDRGEETLLGASIVRGDPERAVMRATLDALNRRTASMLELEGRASS